MPSGNVNLPKELGNESTVEDCMDEEPENGSSSFVREPSSHSNIIPICAEEDLQAPSANVTLAAAENCGSSKELEVDCESPMKRCCVPEEEHSVLRKSLQKLRDQVTDLEVDKLELKASLSASEKARESLGQKLKAAEEQMGLKVKQVQELERAEYEEKLQRILKESAALKKILKATEDLTFKSLESFSSNESKVRFYTGLPSYEVFNALLQGVTSYLEAQSVNLSRFSLKPWQSLLMTLIKLRLSVPNGDLAFRFGVSKATAIRNFEMWIDAMHESVYPVMVKWPERETLWETMPREFRESYGNSVAVIIDCFEVFTEKPSSLETRAVMWSNYKHHHTVKILIGISPTGAIIFVSSGWGARASDKHVVQESGLYDLLLPHDVVMADRGFNIAEHLSVYGAKLLIPAFTRGQTQLSSHDVTLTRKIANLRIHVERVIGLVRNKYKILKSILPVEMLSQKGDGDLAPIDKIVHVCCALTNLCPSIVVHPDVHGELS